MKGRSAFCRQAIIMIKFYTASKTPRPVRLPETIRQWAWDSLHGMYGDEAMKQKTVSLCDIENIESMSPEDRYDIAIRRIAEKAPIRVCEYEKVSGSATLGLAVRHCTPVYWGGDGRMGGQSHLTVDFEETIRFGLDAKQNRIEEKLKDASINDEERRVLQSFLSTIESFRIYHGRYLEATKDTHPDIYETLKVVPFHPATTFREAVQALWMEFSFLRLCGTWPGIGRIDYLLGDYLKNDLKEGRTTIEEAREVLATMFIKGCEWIESCTRRGTGDAQHYQNIVLAGVDKNGKEITNEVTYLVLDIVEELPISDFPISIRLNSKTPAKLLDKAARVVRHGGGVIAFYNEEVVIDALLKDGYELEEARQFANDGCWEVQIPGKTHFAYWPFDGLDIFNRTVGTVTYGEIPDFACIDDIINAFRAGLKDTIKMMYYESVERWFLPGSDRLRLRGQKMCAEINVVGVFEGDCIERMSSYHNCGTKYFVRSPHIGGLPDIANSLLAIQKLVYEEKLISFKELIAALRNNWEGHEELRNYARTKYNYYGNDSDEADNYYVRLVDLFADVVKEVIGEGPKYDAHFVPGISTFGRNVDWLPTRTATAFGYKKGEILAGNASPTPDTDFSGATSVIRSYCKADLRKMTTGAALDLKISPQTLTGRNGLEALKGLMRGFVTLGGFFFQPDTVDVETLLAAQKDPQSFKTLSVRVSGWNARFVTLNDEWQQMIIDRTSQGNL